MGVNYYAKISKFMIDKLSNSPDVSKLSLDCVKHFDLHIGKSSAGWKFMFQEQETPFDLLNSYTKWRNFLNRKDIEIYDEYNQIVDKEEFFKMVEEKQKEVHPTREDYLTDNFPNYQYISKDGYRFNKGDFS